MADEENKDAAGGDDGAKKGGLPLTPIIVVAAVMVVEAVIVAGLFMFMGGRTEVAADVTVPDEIAALEEPVEVMLIASKFQNTSSGENYLYDTEIYGRVKQKHQEKVEELTQQMIGRIKNDVTVIFRRASPTHLEEYDLATLTRQIKASLVPKFGKDPDGEPYLTDLIIGKCTKFAGDY